MKVAASPQSINRAMPEGGIQVTSHKSLVTPNPQSLIPSYSSLLSNFKVQGSRGGFAAFLEDGILVSQPFPLGEGAPQGRIG